MFLFDIIPAWLVLVFATIIAGFINAVVEQIPIEKPQNQYRRDNRLR